MALTAEQRRVRNAGYQARWRAKRNQLARSHPEVTEGALLASVRRAERGQLAAAECTALADKLADLAMVHLRRAQELAGTARWLRVTKAGR